MTKPDLPEKLFKAYIVVAVAPLLAYWCSKIMLKIAKEEIRNRVQNTMKKIAPQNEGV